MLEQGVQAVSKVFRVLMPRAVLFQQHVEVRFRTVGEVSRDSVPADELRHQAASKSRSAAKNEQRRVVYFVGSFRAEQASALRPEHLAAVELPGSDRC